ncbi:glycerol acyltransferase [Solimonas fluminis]|uniref:Glycerol acyltransferase n=1 Tax=Solimonas fluminis TaxID=2086571 RepID=A0A2S5TFR8_9GAMM|nr:MFS transporter [Solimonas fluminis]PPE73846.1 glycerol acyltransferase [Solimonas fluminis]
MSQDSQFSLLRQRRFGPFFLTQALGAFNDNVFKNALVILVTFGIAGLAQEQVSFYVNLAAVLFILPFFLFSATAGQLAEKYEKSRLIRGIKLLEIGIMLLGAVGLWLGSIPLLLGVLFLLGFQAALFGPVKYAILPQHLREEELVGGNAWVEAGTFLAILLGTVLGGWLVAQPGGTHWVAAVVVALALAGYAACRAIPPAAPAAPELRINWNPLTETLRNLRFMRTNRTVFLSVMGISWFWLYGAAFLSQMPTYASQVLGGDPSVATLLLTLFSVGIGAGSLLCERLSGHKVEIGLVPLGSIGLTLFGIDLYLAHPGMATATGLTAQAFLEQPGAWRVVADLVLIGIFGGFYIVPLYALIQTRSEPSHRSRIIAGNNILNALFMVVAGALAVGLFKAGLTIPELLLVVALMNAAVAVFIYSLVPEFMMRFLVWLLTRTLYRIDQRGMEHIPDEGAAVIVCNHVSFVDALILGGNIRRPVRFVMYHKIFRIPVLNFIFRTARAIPIAPAREDEALMHKAFEDIAAALAAGDIVGIFPEGGLTPDGEIQGFRPGIERIIERSPAPVVPMALSGLWESMWSRRDSRLRRMRLPRRLRARIGMSAAPAVPAAEARAAALEQAVRELRGSHP